MNSKNNVVKLLFFLVLLTSFILPEMAYSQARSCDFFGNAAIRGVPVTSGDVIQAYDDGGQLCGTGQCGVPINGRYLIHVDGDDPSTTDIDEGAPEGGEITFRLNGEVAVVTGGSNIFINLGSVACHIDVPDVPPEADPGGPYFGDEGSPVVFNGSGSVGAVNYDWDFGDGSPHGTGVYPSHAYADNATYTVTLTVSNNSSQEDTETTTATISNVDPTVEAGSDKAITEGNAISLDPATFTDPAVGNDTYTAEIDWGDGTIEPGTVTPPTSDGEVDGTHTYVDNGAFTVTVTVSDEDGGSGNDTFTANVSNIPPTVEAGDNQTVDEGAVVNFSGSATDPGVNDVLTYTWDFDDGEFGSGQNTTHIYGDNGSYIVVLTVNDGDNDGTDNLTVTVNNVAPTAEAGGPIYYGVVNQPVQFSGSATDPGSDDVLTYEWDLDDDGQYDDFIGQNPTKTYVSEGTYSVSLRVTDDDGGVDTDDATVEIFTGVMVNFETEPAGMQLIIDGQSYTTPQTMFWVPGAIHTLEAPSSQWEGDGYRHLFDYWSDGMARVHDVVVPTSPITYKAYYQLEYFLDINTSGRGGNPVGEGWYGEGTQVLISIDNEVVDQEGTIRSVFASWTGYGNGAYSGNQRQVIVTMNGPINQIANWSEEYKLDVQSPFGVITGGGWYDPGSVVSFSVDSVVDLGQGMRHFFQSWEGSGIGSYTGSDNPATVTMNGPVLEIAVWESQYFLELISEYGDPTGEGWYNTGDTAIVGIDTVVDGGEGTRVRFLRWEGTGIGSYSGENDTFRVQVNAPITETAVWGTQYYMSLNSVRGIPIGEGWYESGTLVSFSIDSIVPGAEGRRHRFIGWDGLGIGSYSGNERTPDIIIQGPVEEVANWEYQYFVSIQIDPEWGGIVIPIAVPGGWAVADSTLELTAVGNADSSYGFSQWTGDIASEDNPLAIILDAPKDLVAHFSKGRVIVDSEPSGLLVRVDGEEFVSPVVFNWLPNESHQLGVITPQGDNVQTRFTFNRWSDNGLQEHNITVSEDLITYTAIFNASYFLTVESAYGTTVGGGWYTNGSQAAVTVDSLVNETAGIRRKFAGWIGTGNGAVTSSDREIVVTVNGPLTERAQWQPQFKLNLTTVPPFLIGAGVDVMPPGPWFDPGTDVVLEAVITDTSNSFTGWSGGVSDTTNPLILTINSPMNVVANFNTANEPPQIRSLPDLSVLEDGTLRLSFIWLRQFVTDPNDPFDWLVLNFHSGSHLNLNVDYNEEEVRIIPEANWNGAEELVVTVTDPVGMMASDSLIVSVISVADPPGPFKLISPVSGMNLPEWSSPMNFKWEGSANLDLGDEITYSFSFSPYPDLAGFGSFRQSFLPEPEILVMPQPDGVYYWGVKAEDKQGYETWCDEIFTMDILTRVESNTHNVPLEYDLNQNFPNPFNPETTIRYQLPKPGRVKLVVFDMRGSRVCVLVDKEVEAGYYEVIWNGNDEQNRSVASGIYILMIQAAEFVQQRKMILLR